ncbi:hypothetical protein VTO42DRAFT_7411 [Malbranchea cinnamomea]
MGGEETVEMQAPAKPRSGKTTPRVEHFDGEIPPALSPLDAFALQSRLLAKQFEESSKAGRRLSRLPPSSIARSFSQPRPGYFRSISSGDSHRPPPSPKYWGNRNNPEIEEPRVRPKSQHPQLSDAPKNECDDSNSNLHLLPRPNSPARRTESLEPLTDKEDHADQKQEKTTGIGSNGLSSQSFQDPFSSATKANASNNLAPSSIPRPSSSPGLPPPESSDDDYYASSNAGSTFSKSRKMSSSSGVSMPPQSPMPSSSRQRPESPSPLSDVGSMAQSLPKPTFNFSRPLSRSSTTLSLPTPLVPGRSRSPLGPPKQQGMQRERRPPPLELPTQYDTDTSEVENDQPSATYIYSKYSLPRGREVSRDSLIFSGLQTPHFEWKEPIFDSPPARSATAPGGGKTRSPSPQSPAPTVMPKSPMPKSHSARARANNGASEDHLSRPDPPKHSFDQGPEIMSVRPITPDGRTKDEPQPARADDGAKTPSADSEATVRPRNNHSEKKTAMQLTANEHVELGIACHEKGALQESTYHLRLAAMQNHPTGMLLYALACRHGWGMRPNQKEGVQWLRKAVDSIGVDINSVAGLPEPLRGKDLQEQKARQAQFALGIYELGVSHLNGWGIEQDKALALRCFEIAGSWGDADALAEAGYCYVEGVGCKKDLKKAAKYYRMAESKGMSIVGNSWIYKDKYMSDDENTERSSGRKSNNDAGKKPRNKSRTRSIFGRKKSTAHGES